MMMFKSLIVTSLLTVANSQRCSICGQDMEVKAPDALFEFAGQPTVPCGALEDAGENGQIPLDQFSFLEAFISACECGPAVAAPVGPLVAPIVPVAPAAPVAPTDAPVAPTDAPVAPTDAPVAPTDAPVAPTGAPVALTDTPVALTDAQV